MTDFIVAPVQGKTAPWYFIKKLLKEIKITYKNTWSYIPSTLKWFHLFEGF
jgi:hypothetical protein